jgi:HAD superfamily hydrolase (TIGR01509 family)
VAVVFDVDGTLFDSEPHGHRVAFNRAFAEAGLAVHWDLATYGRLLAIPGGRRRIERFMTDAGWSGRAAAHLAAQLHRRKTELLLELALAGRIPPRAGVRRLVQRLREAGADLHVATTASGRWVHPLLSATFGSDAFDLVITAEDVVDLKPAPEAYLHVLRGSGLDAQHAVAVEDSPNGLRAARSAGLACVVVANDYTGGSRFPGAAMVCAGFDEVSPEQLLELMPCQARRARAVMPRSSCRPVGLCQ